MTHTKHFVNDVTVATVDTIYIKNEMQYIVAYKKVLDSVNCSIQESGGVGLGHWMRERHRYNT